MRPSLKVLSYWTWAVPALAAVLPSLPAPEPTGSVLELESRDSYAQATFNVPCVGCLGQGSTGEDDESLTFKFTAYSSEKPCGVSNISLNGLYLAQEWDGSSASGSGSFSGVSDLDKDDWTRQHDLDLEWQSACLYGNESEAEDSVEDEESVAQVLTLTIKSIDGKSLEQSSGFTVSFKQLSTPELLRLAFAPNPRVIEQEFAEDWRAPPEALRLVALLSNDSENIDLPTIELELSRPPSLEDEIRKLKHLEIQAQELQRQIDGKKHHIKLQLKHEAKNFKEELKQCDSITCIISTIAHKAHGAIRIVYIKFAPPHHHYRPMGRPDPYAKVYHASTHNQAPEREGFPPPPQPTPPPPPHHHHAHFPPPPPWTIALKAVLGISCLSCLFAFIRRRCSSLRTRTERAARREERRTARAYRHAARRHAWRSWWSRGFRRDLERIEDYEEKRALIREQENVLEEAMQEEIRQLRAAHGVVNSIVSAEEGRSHSYAHVHHSNGCPCHTCSHPHHVHPQPQPHPHFTELSTRPLSRTNSLPDYRSETSNETEPPAYEDEEDSYDTVVNGFRQYTPSGYTPSTASSAAGSWDETPESSVVDVSPRPSAETMRTLESRFTMTSGNPKN